ncbi:Holliday junction branch migration DNA helicase RuvB [Lactobacillus sp. CC-MHH1034]|uniref:Holliday junction branch migration DNA helicase RuvB n=1 Tax=Agrilactobacillus fermenti TaxID=2586909 RepID=UPI001E581E4E|nr:Holliday junction branch migration DNA helicase RuvB [Agrilactobacillus fermenti]MCD2256762.1 Holliday junction branch migration DNA helicase RuvB [Agrilactobacillus fermenti]
MSEAFDQDRLVAQTADDDQETIIEKSLRPRTIQEYIGQEKIKNELRVYIEAAKKREEALDHVLLYGPPGLGKTTLAFVIGHEMGVHVRTTSGPAIEKSGDLVALLAELKAGDILFIDEIHRLPKAVEEVLYSAMEDFYIDIVVGEGPAAHPVHFPLPPFTLIGATTRAGLLSAPLRDRFGIVAHMSYYTVAELKTIVQRTADIFNIKITADGAIEVGRRSRGTPRVANRLLKRIRDFAQVAGQHCVDASTADDALNQLEVDNDGLDQVDRKILTMIIKFYNGGPVGLKTIAANVGEEVQTIEEMYEPYLMQSGFLKRTPRGRMATAKSYQHLGLQQPEAK